ncbi:MAG: thioredoxin family protein [Ignavibacteria bacterium]|nr:thioredoxin family protein [Ignavibacteria bacterium]
MITIKILGSGCANCTNPAQLCKDVTEENQISAEIVKVTDYKDIMSYGIMSTPGLVINEKVVHSGKLPTKSTLTHMIMNFLAISGE